MGWTEARVARLRDLWKAGYTARDIADDLGGVSRGAVLGKVNRLGLSVQSRFRKPIPCNEPESARTKSCQWPIGDPGRRDFHFCESETVVPGKPYCPDHCAAAYRTPQQWREENAEAVDRFKGGSTVGGWGR